MLNKYFVILYVPLLETSYDLYIPAGKSVTNVTKLIIKSLNDKTDGYYNNMNSKLYFKDNGKMVDITTIVKNSGIHNGTRLILL